MELLTYCSTVSSVYHPVYCADQITWYLSSLTLHTAVVRTARQSYTCFKNIYFVGGRSTLSFFFIISFDQQSEYNVFHKLICWQESSLWTNWRDEFPSSEEISYSWLQQLAIFFSVSVTITINLRVNVFITQTKRLELRALCLPPDQLASSPPAAEGTS